MSEDLSKVEASMEDIVEMGILPEPHEDDLFCVITDNPEGAFDTILMLSTYNPLFRVMVNYDNEPNSIVLVVHENGCMECGTGTEAYRLAEMACQMNYKQVGIVCPVCEEKGLDVCGHLTFKL